MLHALLNVKVLENLVDASEGRRPTLCTWTKTNPCVISLVCPIPCTIPPIVCRIDLHNADYVTPLNKAQNLNQPTTRSMFHANNAITILDIVVGKLYKVGLGKVQVQDLSH